MEFKDLKSVVGEGLRMVRPKLLDNDVMMYEKLKPSDFPNLIEKFGVEKVLAYISDMEKKRKVT